MKLSPTEFKAGVNVISAEGDPIGSLNQVVIDPRTGKITDIVVQRGKLLATDKVISVDQVQSATEDQIILLPGTDLEMLPDFEISYFIPAEIPDHRSNITITEMMPVYWNPPIGSATGYPLFVEPTGWVATERNIPQGTVSLKEGAKVYNADGQHVGDVKRVMYDPESNRLTHIVIEHGLLGKEQKLIPANWIMEIKPDRVNLAVGSRVLDQVKAYQE